MISVVVVTAAVIISAGAALLDYRTYSSPLRTLIILISGALLVGFILESDSITGEKGPIILLTDGTQESDGSQTLSGTVYSLESERSEETGDIKWLSSVDQLPDMEEQGRTVEIYGNGTREKLGDEFRWVNRLSRPEPGILLEQAPQQVDAGTDFQINGRLVTESQIDTVKLYRDGSLIQSLQPENNGTFSFTDRLRVEGPALYHIGAETADMQLRETWHIRATAPEPLSIAVMLYSPSFEITHLAEWLGNSGHQLAMKTRVGNGRFRFDEINNPPVEAEAILGDLSAFDLLILDPREVTEFSAGQIQSVKQAVESGLDVMLLPPSEKREREWERVMTSISGEEIGLSSVSRIEERQWTPEFISLSGQESLVNARLAILNYNFESENNAVTTPGLFENREPVIARIASGNGSVSSHLFYQTYGWKLRGDMNLYSDFWSGYLDQAIVLESPFVGIGSQIPKVRSRIMITTSGSNLMVRQPAQNEEWELPLVSGAEHPGVSYGYFWPRSGGWHVAESEGAQHWFYVYEAAWTFSERYSRYRATQFEIENLTSDGMPGNATAGDGIPARWWLIGFLILQVALWAERKLVG